MQRGSSSARHLIIISNRKQILICALLLPLTPPTTPCCTTLSVCGQLSALLPSCMRSSIPSGTSLLANTQVPVICSKHVILASVAPHPWRSQPFSRCDTGSALTRPLSTVSSQLEPSIWNRPIWASEEVCQIAQCIWCAAWHRVRVSCSDEPSVLGVF